MCDLPVPFLLSCVIQKEFVQLKNLFEDENTRCLRILFSVLQSTVEMYSSTNSAASLIAITEIYRT